jgi:hypothetical protein
MECSCQHAVNIAYSPQLIVMTGIKYPRHQKKGPGAGAATD